MEDNASAPSDGKTWTDAFKALHAAVAVAQPRDEIWVAAGKERPSVRSDPNDPRSDTLQLISGVALYGRFSGVETNRDQRDASVNLTILSGDLSNRPNGPLCGLSSA